jgi:hypothetical protein
MKNTVAAHPYPSKMMGLPQYPQRLVLPTDLINTPPAGGAAEAAGAQTGGVDKVPESLKHPASEKEVEKEGGGEVREKRKMKGLG